MDYLKQELAAAKAIAKKAGAVMLEYFDADQQIETKEDNSPVTIADKKINRLVIEELQKEFDDIVIGEEESSGEYGMGRRWICDPIDGTKAYTWGMPTATFSLGFAIDGEALMGVVYDPFLDRLYEARKGMGSFCNGEKLAVSKKGLNGGILGFSSSTRKVAEHPEYIKDFMSRGLQVATVSGAVYKMCLVARGRFVGYMEPEINSHDVIAGQVIVEEAGGRVTRFDGSKIDHSKPFKGAVFSNGVAHEELLACVKDFSFETW